MIGGGTHAGAMQHRVRWHDSSIQFGADIELLYCPRSKFVIVCFRPIADFSLRLISIDRLANYRANQCERRQHNHEHCDQGSRISLVDFLSQL